jgi:hypothetical protein
MSREPLVYAFHDQTLYIFERAERRAHSQFGGPLSSEFIGQPFGPKPLHQIACLRELHIAALSQCHLNILPLIHGMHFDGCRLSYRVEYDHKINVLSIYPASSLDNWPYANFPPFLPYVPLRPQDILSASYEEFAMPLEPAELTVAVPPPANNRPIALGR